MSSGAPRGEAPTRPRGSAPPTPPSGGVVIPPPEGEPRAVRPAGERFSARSTVMDGSDVARATRRMAHEIVERNHGLADVVLVGLHTGGVPLARALAAGLLEIESVTVPVGRLDVSFYRDDIRLRPLVPHGVTEIGLDLTDRIVVLVDDVLFTGRTI